MSILKTVNTVNRVVVLTSLVYAIWFLANINMGAEARSGGIWKFWTNWTAMTHIAFYFLCLVCEIFSYLKYQLDNFSHRAFIYHGLVVPMGVSVFGAFWALCLIDEELVIPPAVRAFLPDHINHIVHTLILPGLLIEGFTYFHPLPSRKAGLATVIVSNGAYGVLVLYMGYGQGIWVYPFLALINLPLKLAFFGSFVAASCGVYIAFEKLHQITWAEELKED